MSSIGTAEEAYMALEQDVYSFINGRTWDEATGKYGVLAKMVSCEWGIRSGGELNQKGECPPDEINKLACEAVLFLRDDLLETTGKRIWGLTFTLYPNGKFNIDYDYEKPEDYDESEDSISLAQAQERLVQSGIPVSIEDVDKTPEQHFLAGALTRLQTCSAQHSASWGLGTETQWNLDMNSGQLRLSFADGREMNFPVQVVGTYNTQNGSFMWGWDHPSVPVPLRRAAQHVHDYGEEHVIERFTTRTISCSEAEAWEITAAAAQLDNVTGAYRGDAGGTWVYMTFAVPETSPQT